MDSPPTLWCAPDLDRAPPGCFTVRPSVVTTPTNINHASARGMSGTDAPSFGGDAVGCTVLLLGTAHRETDSLVASVDVKIIIKK